MRSPGWRRRAWPRAPTWRPPRARSWPRPSRSCGTATAAPPRSGAAGPAASAALARITPWLHGIGHALPLALFAAALAAPAPAAPVLAALGGLAAIAGGAGWKFWVVLRAGHQQGFAMPKVPRRGSGAYAAPPRLEVA